MDKEYGEKCEEKMNGTIVEDGGGTKESGETRVGSIVVGCWQLTDDGDNDNDIHIWVNHHMYLLLM